MVSTTGAELLPKAAVSCLRDLIIPLATVLTPNVPEALKLLDDTKKRKLHLDSLEDMVTLAKLVLDLGPSYVLLKGGHLPLTCEGKVATEVEERDTVVNVLCNKQQTHILKMKYLDAKNTHGTGCSLACKADTLLLCPSSGLHYQSDNNISKSYSSLLHPSSGFLLESYVHHSPPCDFPC